MTVHQFPAPQPRNDIAPQAFAPTDAFVKEPEEDSSPRPAFLGRSSRDWTREHFSPADDEAFFDWGGLIIAAVVVGAIAALFVIGLHMKPELLP